MSFILKYLQCLSSDSSKLHTFGGYHGQFWSLLIFFEVLLLGGLLKPVLTGFLTVSLVPKEKEEIVFQEADQLPQLAHIGI